MIACREPEEDLEETQDEPVPIATEQGVLHEEFWDDRTGKLLDSEKVQAARAEELRELDRRVWVEADVEECWNKALACTVVGWLQKTSSQRAK